MDRQEFVGAMAKVEYVTDDEIAEIVHRNIESNLYDGNTRGHRNLIVVMEELSELIQQVSKQLRGTGDRIDLLEECADAVLAIKYIQDICNIDDATLRIAVAAKAKRIESVLNKDGIYL